MTTISRRGGEPATKEGEGEGSNSQWSKNHPWNDMTIKAFSTETEEPNWLRETEVAEYERSVAHSRYPVTMTTLILTTSIWDTNCPGLKRERTLTLVLPLENC